VGPSVRGRAEGEEDGEEEVRGRVPVDSRHDPA